MLGNGQSTARALPDADARQRQHYHGHRERLRERFARPVRGRSPTTSFSSSSCSARCRDAT